MMATGLRRFTFTTHITSSVGWVGAVMAFLALAVIALTSDDEATVRGAYLVMAPASWFVLVPLAHVSLLSGVALSLGTPWGLFRHYWVVLKLLITVFSTAILLIYMRTFREMAGVAADPVVELGLVRNPSPVVHAILALVLLMTATVLAIYKPFGMTAYGQRKRSAHGESFTPFPFERVAMTAPVESGTSRWMYIAGIMAVGTVLLLVLMHLLGGSFEH
jgi:hypothetical protein